MRTTGCLCLAAFLLLPAGAFSSTELWVSGRVKSARGGPLAGATVELTSPVRGFAEGLVLLQGKAGPEPAAEVKTDAGGGFRLLVPGAGMWTLVVRAPGHVPRQYSLQPLLQATELPAVTLAVDARARVKVREPSGQLLEGAWVEAATEKQSAPWRQNRPSLWPTQRRTGRTSRDGTLALPRGQGERLEFRVFAPGYGEVEATGEGRVAVTLKPEPPRTLVVRDHRGRPVPGALVRVGEGAWPVGTSDEEGRLGVTPSPTRPLRVRIDLAGGQSHTEVLEPRHDGPLVVFLPPGRSITGRVIDAASRQVVAGAFVWTERDLPGFVRSDGRGQYTLSLPPDGDRASVFAAARGYLPSRIQAPSGESPRGPTLALEPAATVQGRVVNEAEEPVSGVEVRARIGSQGRLLLEPTARTDSQGRFSLAPLRAGRSVPLLFTKDGFVPTGERVPGLEAGETRTGLEITLPGGRRVHGRVVDEAEEPVEGAEVRLSPSDWQAWARTRWPHLEDSDRDPLATSDETGAYEAQHVAAGRFDLEVKRSGFARVSVRGVEVPGGPGEVDLGTVVLVAGVQVEGVVTDLQGEPLAGAEVFRSPGTPYFLHPAETTTGAQGRFVVGDLTRGEKLHLQVSLPGYRTVSVPGVQAPTSELLEVVLEPASRLSGQVVNGDGEPVEGARITTDSDGRRRLMPRNLTVRHQSAADGSFTLQDVEPGRLLVSAYATGYLRSDPLVVEVPPGGEATDVRIVLQRGAATIQGRVLDSGGHPVVGARVSCATVATSSDGDGFYSLAGVGVGRQQVSARRPDSMQGVAAGLDVRAGINTLDLRFEGHRVSGRVLAASGEPVGGAVVTLTGGDFRSRFPSSPSAPDGSFAVSEVKPGRYQVTVWKEGLSGQAQDQEVEVADRPVTGVEVRLEAGGAIVGRVLGLEFDELSGLVVSARDGRRGGRGDVRYDGHYRIPDLPPGEWTVSAYAAGRQVSERVRLDPGSEEVVLDLEFGHGLALDGQVLSDGEPLTGAWVVVRGIERTRTRSTSTDYRGQFLFQELEPGAYRLSVHGHSEEIDLTADASLTVEIRSARVAGRVADSDAIPLSGVRVSLEPLDPPARGSSNPQSLTDADGRFLLQRVAGGRYRLAARKKGYAPAEERVDLAAGQGLEGLELRLTPSEGLVLEVRRQDGSLPSGVWVGVLAAGGGPGADRVVAGATGAPDQAGRIRLPSVPSGDWRLLVTAPGSATVRLGVQVPGPTVPLVLAPEARLEVAVPALALSNLIADLALRDGEGRPFQTLRWQQVREEWRLVGGRAVVEGLPPGTWTLTVAAADGRSWSRTVTTVAGSRTVVTLE